MDIMHLLVGWPARWSPSPKPLTPGSSGENTGRTQTFSRETRTVLLRTAKVTKNNKKSEEPSQTENETQQLNTTQDLGLGPGTESSRRKFFLWSRIVWSWLRVRPTDVSVSAMTNTEVEDGGNGTGYGRPLHASQLASASAMEAPIGTEQARALRPSRPPSGRGVSRTGDVTPDAHTGTRVFTATWRETT